MAEKQTRSAKAKATESATPTGVGADDAQNIFIDYGTTGVPFTEGVFGDRQPAELQGQEGVNRMAQMLRKEPAVWVTQNMITLSARQAIWKVEPPTDSPADREVAEILESMMDDMSGSWWDAIQFAISHKAFGFADEHIVFKRRAGRAPKVGPASKYDDQLIGLRKLAIRRQETIVEWQPDDHGDMKHMVQENPNDGKRYEPVPIERLLHFSGGNGRGSWEGIGWLEPAYKLYYQLEKYELIMGIGHQRAHLGLPVWEYVSSPDAATKNAIETVARNLSVNQQSFVTYPGNIVKFRLESVTNGNGSELREVINQLRWEIMTLGLTQFFRLGTTASGSRALADPLVKQFENSINATLDDIGIVLNRHLVPRIIQVNPTLANKISEEPQFKASSVTSLPADVLAHLNNISTFLSSVQEADQLWLRGLLDMPMITVTPVAVTPDPGADPDKPTKGKEQQKDEEQATSKEKKKADAAAAAKLQEAPYGTMTAQEEAIFRHVSAAHLRALQLITTRTGDEGGNNHAW